MVNQLPQGWKEEELGNLFDITSSKRVFMADWKRTGVPFYRAREIVKLSENGWVDNELFISEEMYNEYAKKYGIPKENDIMITAVGTLGCVYVVKKNDRFYFKDGNIIWLKNRDIINSQYVKYYFQSPFIKRQILDNSGAVVGTYTIIKAKQTKIVYPTDKDEQDYIVKTLDAVAEMIKLRKETIQLTKDLIPAIFQEMFGDPITNPKGWEILSLDNIITQINNGYNPPKKDFGTGIPFVTVNNLYNGLSIDYDSLDKVMVSNKQIQKYKLNYGDICFVRSSVKREGIGQASAYLSNQDAIFGGFVIRVTPKEIFNPIFLSEYFQTEAMRNIIINKSVTGVMTNINQPALLSIPVLNVPFSMQKEFAKKVEQINQNLEVQQKDLERLQELFDQLLQKAFTGELTRGDAYGKH